MRFALVDRGHEWLRHLAMLGLQLRLALQHKGRGRYIPTATREQLVKRRTLRRSSAWTSQHHDQCKSHLGIPHAASK